MEVELLDFVRECKQLAKQALGKHAGEPASGGFTRWKHVVLHCIRIEEDHSYRELVDRVALMKTVCEVLDLDPDDLPDPSTLCKSFDRFKMWVWQQLLRRSAQQLPTSVHAAIDGTYFERTQPSFHYRRRSGREIQTLKAQSWSIHTLRPALTSSPPPSGGMIPWLACRSPVGTRATCDIPLPTRATTRTRFVTSSERTTCSRSFDTVCTRGTITPTTRG